MTRRAASAAGLLLLSALSCGRIPTGRPPEAKVWLVASPAFAPGNSRETGFVFVDSASLRPVSAGPASYRQNEVALFTSYHGSRYHPEAVRAVAEDSSVLAGFGRAFGSAAPQGERPLLIDIQNMAPDDIPQAMAFVRTLGTAFRLRGAGPVGVIVPAGDTVSYPTSIIGRIADLIVVRLTDEHRPGTRPGPLVTHDFIRRALGARATTAGASRLGAEFPLYGYLWNSDGSARRVTFREANDMVIRESGSFRRDPASSFLAATGRDGWTIWVPDARTIQVLIDTALKRGVRFIALAGTAGADPAIVASSLLKR